MAYSFKATTDATQKKAIANTLIREMAIHGDAEYVCTCMYRARSLTTLCMQRSLCIQRIQASRPWRRRGTQQRLVYVPSSSPFGLWIFHATEEHAEVKKAVYDADTHGFDSADYDTVMGKAYTTFISHAQEEEQQQFSQLKAKLTPEESDVRSFSFDFVA